MKLTLETEYGKTIIEQPNDDQDIYEMLDLFERLLFGAGYRFKGELDFIKE